MKARDSLQKTANAALLRTLGKAPKIVQEGVPGIEKSTSSMLLKSSIWWPLQARRLTSAAHSKT